MFIYFWDRERQSMNRGGAEREGDTESEMGSRLWAVSTEPHAGLELTDREIMTWAEVRRLTVWATQVPQGWCSSKFRSPCCATEKMGAAEEGKQTGAHGTPEATMQSNDE